MRGRTSRHQGAAWVMAPRHELVTGCAFEPRGCAPRPCWRRFRSGTGGQPAATSRSAAARSESTEQLHHTGFQALPASFPLRREDLGRRKRENLAGGPVRHRSPS